MPKRVPGDGTASGDRDQLVLSLPLDANGDNIYNGALDNASGISHLIEQARAFAKGPRPDRSVILGVDRETGVVTRLEERVGDTVTRHAEVTYLEPDAPIRDDVFTIHVPGDAVKIY